MIAPPVPPFPVAFKEPFTNSVPVPALPASRSTLPPLPLVPDTVTLICAELATRLPAAVKVTFPPFKPVAPLFAVRLKLPLPVPIVSVAAASVVVNVNIPPSPLPLPLAVSASCPPLGVTILNPLKLITAPAPFVPSGAALSALLSLRSTESVPLAKVVPVVDTVIEPPSPSVVVAVPPRYEEHTSELPSPP